MADSTVILQHVCSVTIFIVCFVGMYHERISPAAVVNWSSICTFLGWILWERWVSEEEDKEDEAAAAAAGTVASAMTTPVIAATRTGSLRRRTRAGSIRRPPHTLRVEPGPSSVSTTAASSTTTMATHLERGGASNSSSSSINNNGNNATDSTRRGSSSRKLSTDFRNGEPLDENRTHQRLGTIKSALLIYSTLLGLSPILKSLTRSTSSDSIWAMSFWLLAINIFFFDYSGGVETKFPASLSTNAALMASTVLASRLSATNQVFSLTLFSIEVFGLFPVFRRHVRHRSWRYHVLQTVVLVLGAGWGVGLVLGDDGSGGVGSGVQALAWKSGILGMFFSVFISVLATGGCSWWLIGLQKYKNEIRGPWDPARPIIMSRTRWDDR